MDDPFERQRKRRERRLRELAEQEDLAGTDPATEETMIAFAYERYEDADVDARKPRKRRRLYQRGF